MRKTGLPLLAAFLFVACGQVQADPAPSNEPGHLTLAVKPSQLSAGGTVHATVRVDGPADYEAGCVQTVRLWALDRQHRQVWIEPAPEVTCMAIINKHLPAGETATFEVDWPTASTPPGRYSIHGLFLFTLPPGAGTRVAENLPPAEVTLQ